MKVLPFARRIAHSEGFKPARNVDLEALIWGRTGYPHFWHHSKPEEILREFEEQLRQAFRDIKSGASKNWEPL